MASNHNPSTLNHIPGNPRIGQQACFILTHACGHKEMLPDTEEVRHDLDNFLQLFSCVHCSDVEEAQHREEAQYVEQYYSDEE